MGIAELSTAEAKRQIEEAERTRRQAIEDDVVIAGDGNNGWAVISRDGMFRWYDEPWPVVLYSGLGTREAAEFARQEAIGQLVDHGSPYGPSEVPTTYFSALGRILQLLRKEGIENVDLLALTHRIAEAAVERNEPGADIDDDTEIPF